jgi:integrase
MGKGIAMRSLINLIPRKNTKGEPYYQARFFTKGGKPLESTSFPETPSRTEAYRLARALLLKDEIASLAADEVKHYGILTTGEVKALLSFSFNKPELRRYQLIVLLGVTCGLGVSEIQNLRWDDIFLNYDWLVVRKPASSRFIPYLDVVRDLITKSIHKDSNSRYVIPNLKAKGKPCNQITITRGLQIILKYLKIDAARHIRPSSLQYTFINILLECHVPVETIDRLCGFSQEAGDETKIKEEKIKAITQMRSILKPISPSYMRWSEFK